MNDLLSATHSQSLPDMMSHLGRRGVGAEWIADLLAAHSDTHGT
jgi:hypothetical protein